MGIIGFFLHPISNVNSISFEALEKSDNILLVQSISCEMVQLRQDVEIPLYRTPTTNNKPLNRISQSTSSEFGLAPVYEILDESDDKLWLKINFTSPLAQTSQVWVQKDFVAGRLTLVSCD